ncbi:MAG: hypothetical protein IKU67_04005 [Firmicutes bacterium]|nr:hypothetical protein [Bacillota bacterium]
MFKEISQKDKIIIIISIAIMLIFGVILPMYQAHLVNEFKEEIAVEETRTDDEYYDAVMNAAKTAIVNQESIIYSLLLSEKFAYVEMILTFIGAAELLIKLYKNVDEGVHKVVLGTVVFLFCIFTIGISPIKEYTENGKTTVTDVDNLLNALLDYAIEESKLD